MNRSFVEKLSEIVRSISVEVSRQLARSLLLSATHGMPEDVVAARVRSLEADAEAGGGVRSEGDGFVTDSNEVTWQFPQLGEVPWDFFGDIRSADFTLSTTEYGRFQARLVTSPVRTSVTLSGQAEHLEVVVPAVEALLDEYVDAEMLEASKPPFRVFIGHGGDRQWEAVRKVVETHYDVSAFETHDRLGQQAFEVVENMISEASVAVIVMTAADERADGKRTARQNVVHELGFAQGRLGARETIIVVEQGTELFSNIESIQQIRFTPGEIHTVEDQVLAALANRKRELESS